MEYTTENSIKLTDKEESDNQTEAEPLESPEPIEAGKSIPVIEERRIRTDSLQAKMSDLKKQEAEMRLKLKIMATKEKMAKMQKRLDEQAVEDSFYNDKPDGEGYRRLRNEKWERDFEDLIIRLKDIEDAEANKTITVEEATEAKKIITKEIKQLKSIKSSVKLKNRMNKFRRGMQKFLKGSASFSKEMRKFGDSMSTMGTGESSGGNASQFENFFTDRKTPTTKSKKKSKRKSKKKRKKGKKNTETETESQPSSTWSGF